MEYAINTKKFTVKVWPVNSLIAVIYGLILASLPNDWFRDRDNYIIYAKNLDVVFDRYDYLSFFFNEPLFILYNKLLSNFASPEIIPKLGVFFISSTIVYFILKYSKNWLAAVIGLFLLFFVSYTFHLQLVAIRQGVATALLLWVVHFYGNKNIFYVFCFLLSFFHISFIVISFLLLFDLLLEKLIKDLKIRMLLFLFVIFCSSLILLNVASFLGVRQASSDHLTTNNFGHGGFLLFLFVGFFFWLRGLNNVYRNVFGKISFLGVLVYLGFYYTIPISGRIIGTFLPFFYVYFVSEFRKKTAIAAVVFLLVNLIIFQDSIKGGSLTYEGVQALEYSIID